MAKGEPRGKARSFGNVEAEGKRGWLRIVALALVGTSVPLLLAPTFVGPALNFLFQPYPVVLLPGILAWAFLAAFWLRPRKLTGELELDADELRVGGERLVSRRDVRRAVAYQKDLAWWLQLTTRTSAMQVKVPDAESAEAILTELGHSATQRTATFLVSLRGLSHLRMVLVVAIVTMLAGVAIPLLGHGVSSADVFILPLVIAVLSLVATLVSSRKLVMGADGFVLRSAWGEELVRYRDIEAVGGSETVVSMQLRGRTRALSLTCGAGSRRLQQDELLVPARAIRQRLEEGRHRSADTTAVTARALLARGERTRDEWLKALTRLSADAATFRTAEVPDDQLWQILNDPNENAELRSGAALALRPRLDVEGRAKVRVAANAIVEAPLKRVLTAVAEDDALDDALGELERTTARVARSGG